MWVAQAELMDVEEHRRCSFNALRQEQVLFHGLFVKYCLLYKHECFCSGDTQGTKDNVYRLLAFTDFADQPAQV